MENIECIILFKFFPARSVSQTLENTSYITPKIHLIRPLRAGKPPHYESLTLSFQMQKTKAVVHTSLELIMKITYTITFLMREIVLISRHFQTYVQNIHNISPEIPNRVYIVYTKVEPIKLH